jgi:small subunit ribosomal protein S18
MADMKRGGSSNRDNSGDKEGRGMRPRRSRRKVCSFCADKIEHIEFKETGKLRKFVSERGKILPKRMSGNCARHQRELTIAIKRARHVALLPYSGE